MTIKCFYKIGSRQIIGPLSELDCFEYDLNWAGTVISELAGVFSPRDCQSLCTFNAACTFFVYRHTDRHCFLKMAKSGVNEDPNLISGPRQCTMYNGKKYSYCNRTKVVQTKSSLLMKIILQNIQTLQIFTINMKQKLFTKVIKKCQVEGLGLEDLKFN
jgi:hypothetical protein